MSKIAVVKQIKEKLNALGVSENGCHNLNIELSNGNKISWVSRTQVMLNVPLGGALSKNRRYPLYSKVIDSSLLNIINDNL